MKWMATSDDEREDVERRLARAFGPGGDAERALHVASARGCAEAVAKLLEEHKGQVHSMTFNMSLFPPPDYSVCHGWHLPRTAPYAWRIPTAAA